MYSFSTYSIGFLNSSRVGWKVFISSMSSRLALHYFASIMEFLRANLIILCSSVDIRLSKPLDLVGLTTLLGLWENPLSFWSMIYFLMNSFSYAKLELAYLLSQISYSFLCIIQANLIALSPSPSSSSSWRVRPIFWILRKSETIFLGHHYESHEVKILIGRSWVGQGPSEKVLR